MAELIVALLVGVASSLLAMWLASMKKARAVVVGIVFGLVAAIGCSLWPPVRFASVSWCQAQANVRVEGRLEPVALRFGSLPSSVQMKIYEPGRGDPPLQGPVYAAVASNGRFSATLATPSRSVGYLVNLAYPFGTLLGERWEISDFRFPPPSSCA
jgi:hypothetical protein